MACILSPTDVADGSCIAQSTRLNLEDCLISTTTLADQGNTAQPGRSTMKTASCLTTDLAGEGYTAQSTRLNLKDCLFVHATACTRQLPRRAPFFVASCRSDSRSPSRCTYRVRYTHVGYTCSKHCELPTLRLKPSSPGAFTGHTCYQIVQDKFQTIFTMGYRR